MVPSQRHSGKGKTETILSDGAEMNKSSTRDILGSETVLCGAVMVDVCYDLSVETHRTQTTMSEH